MLTFDDSRLDGRLAGLGQPKRLAFAASCCERVAPVYFEWAALESPASTALIQEVLELIWDVCLRPTRQSQDRLRAIDLEAAGISAHEDYAATIGGYAADALIVFDNAVRLHRSGSMTNARECAYWVLVVVDALAMAREPNGLITAAVRLKLSEDRSVQRELRKQESDLGILSQARELDSQMVASLRGESARLGQRLLDEIRFTVETDRRGRRPS